MAGKQFAREVAKRVFALEVNNSVPVEKTGTDEFEPKYVMTELGEKVNRVFICGVVTEKETVGNDIIRARIADPTGVFTMYAGEYQSDARADLEKINVPEYVSVIGKVNTYSLPDNDKVFISIRPETVNVIDEKTRDRWISETSQLTLERAKSSEVEDTLRNMYIEIAETAIKSVCITS
jgi:RPA family protein